MTFDRAPARLAGADEVIVDEEKVRDYLLSREHPVGRFKASVFESLGYQRDAWQALQRDLAVHARTGTVLGTTSSPFGDKHMVGGTLIGPNGRSGRFVSVWLVAAPGVAPRLITAYPE